MPQIGSLEVVEEVVEEVFMIVLLSEGCMTGEPAAALAAAARVVAPDMPPHPRCLITSHIVRCRRQGCVRGEAITKGLCRLCPMDCDFDPSTSSLSHHASSNDALPDVADISA